MPVRLDVSSGQIFFIQKYFLISLQVYKKYLPLQSQNGSVA